MPRAPLIHTAPRTPARPAPLQGGKGEIPCEAPKGVRGITTPPWSGGEGGTAKTGFLSAQPP
ncbi:hypothetical protein vBDshSR4C_047 [Dinoroseobacter phage vB_DshS-R4C]|nr:hypothetical protein vBDshSR4C_047 [Dinoroseobacter phage vB_DshS-R4C]